MGGLTQATYKHCSCVLSGCCQNLGLNSCSSGMKACFHQLGVQAHKANADPGWGLCRADDAVESDKGSPGPQMTTEA